MERKLASIQKVTELNSIEGADKIEVCTVLGWKCVVKKGQFKLGDIGIYFEVDSILPTNKPEFAFLESKRGRIKTIKLKKQISQGLFLAINEITYADLSNCKEDDDVTDLLGIKKYEPPEDGVGGAFLGGRHKSTFPNFLRKTDEIRIQAMPSFIDRHRNKTFYMSEKLDGSSITLYYLKDEMYGKPAGTFGMCSRNIEFAKPEGEEKVSAFWNAVIKYNIEEKLREYNQNICIQGELIGPGIQKNKYKLEDFQIYLFNAYDVVTQRYLPLSKLQEVARALNLNTVPILKEFELNHSVDELVNLSTSPSVLNPNTLREGIVCRPIDNSSDEYTGRASFKVISPEFLLKYDL